MELMFLLFLLIFFIPLFLAVWGYKDALRRGKTYGFALGIALLNLFLPIIGTVIYLFIRKM